MIFEEFPGDGIDTIFLILSGKKRVRKRFESYNKTGKLLSIPSCG